MSENAGYVSTKIKTPSVGQEIDGLTVTPDFRCGRWWWVWHNKAGVKVHAGLSTELQLVVDQRYELVNGLWRRKED